VPRQTCEVGGALPDIGVLAAYSSNRWLFERSDHFGPDLEAPAWRANDPSVFHQCSIKEISGVFWLEHELHRGCRYMKSITS